MARKPLPLADRLQLATREIEEAQQSLRRARTEVKNWQTSVKTVLQRVNEKQRLFDELVIELKSGAPDETDWSKFRAPPVIRAIAGDRLPSPPPTNGIPKPSNE